MRSAVRIIAASAVLTSAQVIVTSNGTYTCPIPNAAYCAGDSLTTEWIIRCDGQGQGHIGHCSDNLAGEPPLGVQLALCWQTSVTSGDAACEKNCVVYGGSGNANGTFPLPPADCSPHTTVSTSVQTPTATVDLTCASSTSVPSSLSNGSLTTVSAMPSSSSAWGGLNYTLPAATGTSIAPATPVASRPSATTTLSMIPSSAAEANRATGAMAALGMFAVYFL